MFRQEIRDQASSLVEQYFHCSGNELHIGEIPISDIAAKYGTPLFVYDCQILERKWSRLRKALPSEFAISYSVKANPNQAILRYFLSKGCGLEVASGGELYQAIAAGCPPEKIVFAGPGKTEAELELALKENISEIHAESLLEVKRIGSISRRLGIKGRLALRINPSEEVQGGAMRMGGKPSPFGIDEERVDVVLDRILSDQSMEFRGIHLFIGTQILDYNILVAQYKKGIQLAWRIANRLQHSLKTVDFGGGFGIPYFPYEQELDVERLGHELSVLMEEIKHEPLFEGTQFMLEPGRFLVGEAGIYVTCVNDIKVSRGRKFLIVDGGMHHHLAASGNLGQAIKRNFPLALLTKINSLSEETVEVVGPLCTPLDVLGRSIKLPKAEVGNLIGIFQSGAYARSASPLRFLSHLTPPEVWVEDEQDRLIRRRGKYQECEADLEGFPSSAVAKHELEDNR